MLYKITRQVDDAEYTTYIDTDDPMLQVQVMYPGTVRLTDAEARSYHARAMGRIRSAKKTAAVRINARKGGRRRQAPTT